MNYRRMGKSGLKVSEIALGGWLTFGGSVDSKTTERIVGRAVDLGVNFIDIADIYARGKAEEAIGRAIKGIMRSNLVISSKLFWPLSDDINDRGLSRKHIMESIDRSLRRIGTDYLDIYFCHRFDPETEIEEVVRAMDDLVRQGKVVYWGTSVWTAEQIDQAVTESRVWLAHQPSVEQPCYNMLDRSIERDVLPTCARHGLGLTVWSPLAQGVLTGKYNDGLPAGSRGATSDWGKSYRTPENIDKIRRLAGLAETLGLPLSRLALAWILRHPEITCAITGATACEHIEENVMASEVKLPYEAIQKIEDILRNDPNKAALGR